MRPGKGRDYPQVNAAVRADFEGRLRHKLLEEYLDRLDGEHGPVDEALVEKYVGLFQVTGLTLEHALE